jgi:ABC-2 type transport system ATP-binding protein
VDIRKAEDYPLSETNNAGEPSSTEGIVVEQITKTYKGGKIKALNGLNLHIKPGEAFGLIGPNGAGKTTFFGCLLAFLKVDSGRITVDGQPPDSLDTRRHVGYLPERLNFDAWMSGREFLEYHHALAEQSPVAKVKDCEELLNRVGLRQEAWDLTVKKYSRGMLQRLGLAQALLGKPKYLLLDEPSSGVDPGGVLLVRNVLKDLKKEGVTIVLNSHQLDQVEKVCDRVAFISSGQVEAIENLNLSDDNIKELEIQWLSEQSQDSDQIAKIIAEQGATLVSLQQNSALIAVSSNEIIAATIKALVLNGVPVIYTALKESRLERYFLESRKE